MRGSVRTITALHIGVRCVAVWTIRRSPTWSPISGGEVNGRATQPGAWRQTKVALYSSGPGGDRASHEQPGRSAVRARPLRDDVYAETMDHSSICGLCGCTGFEPCVAHGACRGRAGLVYRIRPADAPRLRLGR